ncbi:hypothetical protein RRG08_037510 [Elysia crispata]|uniref:Tetraspanin n=1 Tax=Elysia crispata TaxID=231223 RepID=A0AAE1DSD3_9GAST|nr:hypothetical protein RRG08_037510 [Elysia crispata]
MSSPEKMEIIEPAKKDLGMVVNCMKIMMMIFNVIFLMTGVLVLALGIYVKVALSQYIALGTLDEQAPPFILISVGFAIVVVGASGIFCLMKNKAILLFVFAGFVLLLFFILLGAGIALVVYREKLMTDTMVGLKKAMKNYGKDGEEALTVGFDFVQSKLKCCGIKEYTDWNNHQSFEKKSVPQSCCKGDVSKCTYQDLDHKTAAMQIHTQGCHVLLVDFISENLGPIGGIAVGISLFLVLGAVLAVFIGRSIRNHPDNPV